VEEKDEEDLVTRWHGAANLARPFEGVMFRSCAPRYAKEPDVLRGEGSRRLGGRWNPIGLAALYMSLTPEVAMSETLAHHRYYGLAVEAAMPRVFVAIEVGLRSVVDLRSPLVLRRLGLVTRELLHVDWRREIRMGRVPRTQAIGATVHAAGCEGVVVPSAAIKGSNLVVFPDRLVAPSFVRLHSMERDP